MTSQLQNNKIRADYRKSNYFDTAGTLEHKSSMADSKKALYQARYSRFAGPKLYFDDTHDKHSYDHIW